MAKTRKIIISLCHLLALHCVRRQQQQQQQSAAAVAVSAAAAAAGVIEVYFLRILFVAA